MPTRAKRRRQARALHNPETMEKAWLRLLDIHRTGSPAEVPYRRSHLRIFARSLHKIRIYKRPHGLTTNDVKSLVRSWLATHQASATIARRLSTLRWVARYTGNPGLIQPSNGYYLALGEQEGEDPMAKVNTDPPVPMSSRSLRHWLAYVRKDRYTSSSHATQHTRVSHLRIFAQTIHSEGYNPKPQNISTKHINAAVRSWLDAGIEHKTIENRLSTLRWFSKEIGKSNLLYRENSAYLREQPRGPERTAP